MTTFLQRLLLYSWLIVVNGCERCINVSPTLNIFNNTKRLIIIVCHVNDFVVGPMWRLSGYDACCILNLVRDLTLDLRWPNMILAFEASYILLKQ